MKYGTFSLGRVPTVFYHQHSSQRALTLHNKKHRLLFHSHESSTAELMRQHEQGGDKNKTSVQALGCSPPWLPWLPVRGSRRRGPTCPRTPGKTSRNRTSRSIPCTETRGETERTTKTRGRAEKRAAIHLGSQMCTEGYEGASRVRQLNGFEYLFHYHDDRRCMEHIATGASQTLGRRNLACSCGYAAIKNEGAHPVRGASLSEFFSKHRLKKEQTRMYILCPPRPRLREICIK